MILATVDMKPAGQVTRRKLDPVRRALQCELDASGTPLPAAASRDQAVEAIGGLRTILLSPSSWPRTNSDSVYSPGANMCWQVIRLHDNSFALTALFVMQAFELNT